MDGFFPITDIENLPEKTRRTGLRELDLPYATDPVISKHLARFLTRSHDNARSSETLSGKSAPKLLMGVFSRPPQSYSTAASSKPLRSDGATLTKNP